MITLVQKKLLGTADAVKCVQGRFKNYRGDVLILCGDTPLLGLETIKRLVRKHRKLNAVCTFLTSVVHNPQGYGRVIRGEKDVVLAIREEKDASDFERNIAEINVGVYCFNSQELFKAIKAVKANKKKKEFYTDDELPPVTVIIPAFNEESSIEKTIQSILNSEYPTGKLNLFIKVLIALRLASSGKAG